MVETREADAFIEALLREHQENRLRNLRGIRLEDLVGGKNPYLFRARHGDEPGGLVGDLLAARLSSSEESLFGSLLERVAAFVCERAHGGAKSGAAGIDLEFRSGGKHFFVSVKSGPRWGNASQRSAMGRHFEAVRRTLATSGGSARDAVFVEGCCYGRGDEELEGWRRVRGRAFWSLVSGGNGEMYRELIEPLGRGARDRSDEFRAEYDGRLAALTKEFKERFCLPDGSIDWDGWVRRVSGPPGPPGAPGGAAPSSPPGAPSAPGA